MFAAEERNINHPILSTNAGGCLRVENSPRDWATVKRSRKT